MRIFSFFSLPLFYISLLLLLREKSREGREINGKFVFSLSSPYLHYIPHCGFLIGGVRRMNRLCTRAHISIYAPALRWWTHPWFFSVEFDSRPWKRDDFILFSRRVGQNPVKFGAVFVPLYRIDEFPFVYSVINVAKHYYSFDGHETSLLHL